VGKVRDPAILVSQTIYQNMPEEVVEVMKKNELKIRLDKVVANRLVDQMPGMVATDGCISAPSGPSC
jgi:hypothetical protein